MDKSKKLRDLLAYNLKFSNDMLLDIAHKKQNHITEDGRMYIQILFYQISFGRAIMTALKDKKTVWDLDIPIDMEALNVEFEALMMESSDVNINNNTDEKSN